MAKARFLYANLCTVTGVTITPSSAATDYPASFLANPARWKPWRSTTTTGNQDVVFDFGSSKTLTAVALVNWKGHTGGTIKAQYWNGSTYVDLGTFTQSVTSSRVIALWFASQASSRLKILFTNTGAVNEYVELGVVVGGQYLEPSGNISVNLGRNRNDPSVSVESPDGQDLTQQRSKFFDVAMLFPAANATDNDNLLAMFETNGRSTEMIFALNADTPATVAYGKLGPSFDSQFIPTPTVERWRVSLMFRESR